MSGRILVLDDEENYAEMLRDLLLKNNYRVDMATRPERAIRQLEEIPYDLVIADYKMPVMDGAGFLKRSRELYPNLPFILVSGLMNTPELVKVANMSVTLVLEKPLDTELFLSSVARFSSPVSDEELHAPSGSEDDSDSEDPSAIAIPDTPKFCSGVSAASLAFLEDAWAILSKGSFLYVGSPKGGDLDLALKDFSEWLGNEDKPVKEYTLPALLELGLSGLKVLQDDLSSVALVRLTNATQISEAQDFVASSEPDKDVKVVFEIRGSYARSAKNLEGMLVQLPDFRLRMGDVAAYASRLAKVSAKRLSKPKCAEYTNEAVFAILEYPWPGNYVELQSAIQTAVEKSEDKPLSLSSFGDIFSMTQVDKMVPGDRLKYLLKQTQAQVLVRMSGEEEGGFESIQKQLEIDPGVTDLDEIPLLKPELSDI